MRRAGPALAIAAALLAGSARAQEPSASDVAAARQLGSEGVKLANAGNCAAAVDKLTRAEHLYHAPTTAAPLGECLVDVGRIVEGTEVLQKLLREPLAPNAPQVFVKAHARAREVLESAKKRIAKLVISVKSPPGAQVSVTVDGAPVSSALLDTERPTDPGDRIVEAKGPGVKTAHANVKLAPGERRELALTVEADATAPPPPKPVPTVVGPEPAPKQPAPAYVLRSPDRTAPTILLVTSGVAFVTGALFGVVAMNRKATLDRTCEANVCPPGSEGAIDSARTSGTVSTIAFVAGGVALAASVILYLVTGKDTVSRAAFYSQ
jgi:hypothetical protein